MSRTSHTWRELIVVLAAACSYSIVTALAAAQPGNERSRYESPALQQLSRALAAGRPDALDEFWARTNGHVPLIEPIDGQDDHRWITFLWRGDSMTSEVSIGSGDIPTPNPRKWTFSRLSTTNVWFKTDRVPKEARFTYLLQVNGGPLQPDPLNDRRFGGRSVAELPDAAPQPWIVDGPNTPKGQLTAHTLQSRVLGEERSIGVYTPSGYTARGPRQALLIVFDGEMYGNAADALIPTPRVLDNLLAAKRIPATMAILVNNMSQSARDRDLRCSAAFGNFLATELVPWVRARYHVSRDASQMVLAGSSDGGLAALCAAHAHSKVFANVLSQSANVFYSPEPAALRTPISETQVGSRENS